MEIEGASVVVIVKGPGRSADMKPDAAMLARSCARMVCEARRRRLGPRGLEVRKSAMVTYGRRKSVLCSLA